MAHPAQADSLPQDSPAQAPYSGVLALVLTCAAPAMLMLRVTVTMKRTHELGDGADDHAGLYVSRCQSTMSVFVLDCKVLGVIQNPESIVIMHFAILFQCTTAAFVGMQNSKIIWLGFVAFRSSVLYMTLYSDVQ